MKNILFLIISLILFSCSKGEPVSKNLKEENLFHKKARKFRDTNISDSAFYYYTLAKDEYIKNNDSLRIGQSLVNMAIIETSKGDFYGSIETCLEANKFFTNVKDSITRRDLASSFNNMGIASGFMYNYDHAIIFYKNAIRYAINNETKYTYYNNIGVALLKKNDFKNAINYFSEAILTKNNTEYARALNNFAKAKFMEDKNYNPLPEFYKALEIRKKNNDLDGLNSSYYTLSEYYKNIDKNKALFYTEKMLETATALKNPEDKLQALIKLIDLNTNNISIYFKKYQSLNDSLLIARNKAKNQFAYFRYGIEKEKAENLGLKADAIVRESHILQKNYLLGALFSALIILTIWYRKRQIRLRQENELKIKENQLKISKKVHDVVANGIYQVMTKIENQDSFNKNEALDELEFVYEKSRDISYDKIGEEKEFSKVISELIASFNNETVKTFTAGNSPAIWESVSPIVKEEVYQMLRELMVNMRKHSLATHVAIKFEKINNVVEIQYKDNGIGISGDLVYKNGLRNAASRTEAISGTITFDTKIEKGLKVNLSFPVS
jgi:tetratricopeptide (TPR) repeat protein